MNMPYIYIGSHYVYAYTYIYVYVCCFRMHAWREGLALGQALVACCTSEDETTLRERVTLGHHRDCPAPIGFSRAVFAADRFVRAQIESAKQRH